MKIRGKTYFIEYYVFILQRRVMIDYDFWIIRFLFFVAKNYFNDDFSRFTNCYVISISAKNTKCFY